MEHLNWTHKWHTTNGPKKIAKEIGNKTYVYKASLKNYTAKLGHENDTIKCGPRKQHIYPESDK